MGGRNKSFPSEGNCCGLGEKKRGRLLSRGLCKSNGLASRNVGARRLKEKDRVITFPDKKGRGINRGSLGPRDVKGEGQINSAKKGRCNSEGKTGELRGPQKTIKMEKIKQTLPIGKDEEKVNRC